MTITEQILDPKKDMQTLSRALEKVFEIEFHEEEVQKAFTKGSKPPIKFSEQEYLVSQ